MLLLISMVVMPAAASASQQAGAELAAAETLHKLGLFRGVSETGGVPDFALGETATRMQGLIMLTRLLGVYDAALASSYPNPFSDVQGEYNARIASFAYARGLTTGVGQGRFNPTAEITATEYLTFVLRALGYISGGDFAWNAAWELTDILGITGGEFNAARNTMTRGELAVVSLRALFTEGPRGSILFEMLAEEGALNSDEIGEMAQALDELLARGVINQSRLQRMEAAIEALLPPPAEPPVPVPPPPPPQPPVGGAGAGNQNQPELPRRGTILFIQSGGVGWAEIDGGSYTTVRAFDQNGQPISWGLPADWPIPGTIALQEAPDGNIASGFYAFEGANQGRFALTQLGNGFSATAGVFSNVLALDSGLPANSLTFHHGGEVIIAGVTGTTLIRDLRDGATEVINSAELKGLVNDFSQVQISVLMDAQAGTALSIFVMTAV